MITSKKDSDKVSTITNVQVSSFATTLQLRAEVPLSKIGVKQLSDKRIQGIYDAGEGAGNNVTMCNAKLVDFLEIKAPSTMHAKREMLKWIAKLTLITLCLSSLEGSGHIDFTESMASIFIYGSFKFRL